MQKSVHLIISTTKLNFLNTCTLEGKNVMTSEIIKKMFVIMSSPWEGEQIKFLHSASYLLLGSFHLPE